MDIEAASNDGARSRAGQVCERRRADPRRGQAVNAAAAPLEPGTPAPDVELRSTPSQMVRLSEFRGRPVILAFYPEDWSPVCSDQMALYQEVMPKFRRYDAELLGISVDGIWSHLAFAKDRNLHFPCSPTSSPRARSPALITSIGPTTARASERCS
jgi:thiol-disulfide isomerase/thioredoxin